MRKHILIGLLSTVMLATLSFGAEDETAYTHVCNISSYVQKTAVKQTAPSVVEAIGLILTELKTMRYVPDPVEHLQYPEQLLRTKTGDCEDFTLYTLWRARQLGVPLHELGFCLIMPEREDKAGHIIPLVFMSGVWVMIESAPPGKYNMDLISYILRYAFQGDPAIIFTSFGLHQHAIIESRKVLYPTEFSVNSLDFLGNLCLKPEQAVRGWFTEASSNYTMERGVTSGRFNLTYMKYVDTFLTLGLTGMLGNIWYEQKSGVQTGVLARIGFEPPLFRQYRLVFDTSVGVGYASGDGRLVRTGPAGLVDAGVGILIPTGIPTDCRGINFVVGYKFSHVSSLKPGDSGVNLHGVNIGIRW